MKQHYCIVNDTVKENLIAYIRTLPVNPRAPMVVEAREETRTDKQNRLMSPPSMTPCPANPGRLAGASRLKAYRAAS